jgi:hypothetical protein
MKKSFIIFLLATSVIMTGCATNRVSQYLKSGDYAQAYHLSVLAPIWKEERPSVIDKIMSEVGGSKGDGFYFSLKTMLKYSPKEDRSTYTDSIKVWEAAIKDGLISENQHRNLKKDLLHELEDAVIADPRMVENQFIEDFMISEGANPVEKAMKNIKKLDDEGDYSAEKHLKIYKFINEDKYPSYKTKAMMAYKNAVQKSLTISSNVKNYESIKPSIEYINITRDRSLDKEFVDKLASIDLSRKNISELESIFPDFAKSQIKARVIKIEVKTNGDEFLAGEITEFLQKRNEWIEIDDQSPRKLNLIRLKFNEQTNSQNNITEIVSDPSFATLLFIPKNASVLFDYSVNEYALQWNFSAQDTLTKKTKPISGAERFKKIECRNFRFQNVFGGIGAINPYPNDRVQWFCTQNSKIDFNEERKKVVEKIAESINENFYVSN